MDGEQNGTRPLLHSEPAVGTPACFGFRSRDEHYGRLWHGPRLMAAVAVADAGREGVPPGLGRLPRKCQIALIAALAKLALTDL